METFYQITQYALSCKGEEYRKSNPEAPWGCIELTKDDINNIYEERYDDRVANAKEYLETGGCTWRRGRLKGQKRKGGFYGMKNILDEETGYIKTYEEWLNDKPTPKYFENPDFYFTSTRGYVQKIEDFESYPCMYSLSEGNYYTRFRLSERYFGFDVFSHNDDHLYEVYSENEKPDKCDEWIGFQSCGDLIGCDAGSILSYVEKNFK